MRKETAIARPTIKSIASHVNRNAPTIQQLQTHTHETLESVREADYKSHHIRIRTIYQVEVDGVKVTGHLGVTEDGRVHYHAIPNVSFASAIDMVKRLIDVFPDDFAVGAHEPEPGADHQPTGSSRQKSLPVAKGKRANLPRK